MQFDAALTSNMFRLITRARPTAVVYMSKDGPAEVVQDLQGAAVKDGFFTLPSQASEYTTRTAAVLRTMQYMSYFHVHPHNGKPLTWENIPLTNVPPWEYVAAPFTY